MSLRVNINGRNFGVYGCSTVDIDTSGVASIKALGVGHSLFSFPAIDMKSFPKINKEFFATLPKFNWKKLVQVQPMEMSTIRITPEKMVTNGVAVESIYNVAHSLYKQFDKRWYIKGLSIIYKRQEVLAFTTVYDYRANKLSIDFYMLVPKSSLHQMLAVLKASPWGKSTLDVLDGDPIQLLDPAKTLVSEWRLKEHLFKSLDTNMASTAPIPSRMGAGRVLQQGDFAVLDILIEPVNDSWKKLASMAHKKWKKDDESVKPLVTNPRGIGFVMFDSILNGIVELPLKFLDAFLGVETDKPNKEQRELEMWMNREKHKLSNETNQKTAKDAFSVNIRVAAMSENTERAEKIVSAIGTSLKDANGDNELVEYTVKKDGRLSKSTSTAVDRLKRRRQSGLETVISSVGINNNIITISEVAKLTQLPTASVQELYPEIAQQSFSEANLDEDMTTDTGIPIAVTTSINPQKLYLPIKRKDDQCAPTVMLGGQGAGKTAAVTTEACHWFGNHLTYEDWVKNGRSVFMYDVADGDMIHQFLLSVPPDRRHRVIILNFGNTKYPIACTFDEAAKYGIKDEDGVEDDTSAFELGLQTVEFLENITRQVMGERTRKYFLSACMAIFEQPDGTIHKAIRCLKDMDFLLEEVIPHIKDRSIRRDLLEFAGISVRDREEIVSPIMNRTYRLQYNRKLWNCVAQPPHPDIDYRKWMDGDEEGPYAVLVWVPNTLTRETQNAIMAQQARKLWFATLTRMSIPKDERKPFLTIYDEIHQFVKATEFFKSMFREARKFRMAVRLLFHEWGAIQDKELADAIMGAEPNIFLLKGSEANYDKLKNSLTPYTREEYMNMPFYHAICRMRSNQKTQIFAARLLPPFASNHTNYDNTELWDESAKKYGRSKQELDRIFDIDKSDDDDDIDIISQVGIDGIDIASI